MSQQLHTAMTDILAMPYYKNDNRKSGASTDGHEEAVAVRIKDAGFVEANKTNFPGITKSMLKKFAQDGDDTELRKVTQGLAVGSYMIQPSGSQGFPDVLVLDFNDKFVCIECKSGKGVSPMWNDSLPYPDTIYVFATKKTDETTIFMGRDVLSMEERELHNKFMKEVGLLVDKYRALLKPLDLFTRGWLFRARPQNFQEGGAGKTNYFTHSKRKSCELLALEYARQ